MKKVTLGLLQHACDADPASNLQRALQLATRAAGGGAQIICTQELFRSQYFCQSEDYANFALAESIPGPSTEAFQEFARKHGVVVIASLFEKRAAGVYHNSAAIIDADGSLLGIYRKMHIPDDPLFYEKFYFTPGDSGFRAWPTRFGTIGVLICWDQWYPEAARLTAMHGARNSVLSHRNRLASRGKSQTWRETTRRVGDDPACARDRQRLSCRRRQSDRSRTSGRRRRPGVLGPEFCGGNQWRDHRPGGGRSGGGIARHGRPGRDRRYPHPLAVSARSSH